MSNVFFPVDSFIKSAIDRGAFPGASWGVAQHGRVLALSSAGHLTYDEHSPRVCAETIYDIASLTKVVATTAAAMLLYERGLLVLDTPVGDLLPGFVIAAERNSGKRLVTLRMLLAHSSGLPGYVPFFREQPDLARPEAWRLFRDCLSLPLTAAPGTQTEYSDPGFILLGKALEVLAGEPLDAFCQREIFLPLGMTATLFRPDFALRAVIPPTEDDTVFRHRVIQGEVHDENCWVLGGCSGHAGLFAPVGDLLRFAEGILASVRSPMAGETKAPTLFRGETVELFARRSGPAGSSRALGWDTPSAPSSSGSYFSTRSIGHLGYTGTSLWLDLDRDVAVVLLTNRTWPTRENKAIQELRPDFHNLIMEHL